MVKVMKKKFGELVIKYLDCLKASGAIIDFEVSPVYGGRIMARVKYAYPFACVFDIFAEDFDGFKKLLDDAMSELGKKKVKIGDLADVAYKHGATVRLKFEEKE